MKMVIIEPLGVDEDKLLSMAKEALGDRVEIVYHDTKATGTQELIERGKDAEIIVVSNLPLNEDVINVGLRCATARDTPPVRWPTWYSAC